MTEEELELLHKIRNKVMKDSSFIGHIVNTCVSGVVESERKLKNQASDMETVAIAMLALLKENRAQPALRKEMSNLALSKLKKYYPDKLFMRWDASIIFEDGKEI